MHTLNRMAADVLNATLLHSSIARIIKAIWGCAAPPCAVVRFPRALRRRAPVFNCGPNDFAGFLFICHLAFKSMFLLFSRVNTAQPMRGVLEPD